MTPITIMKAFYAPNSTVSIAFRHKGDDRAEWTLCVKPLWLFGECNYKIVDVNKDDFNLM